MRPVRRRAARRLLTSVRCSPAGMVGQGQDPAGSIDTELAMARAMRSRLRTAGACFGICGPPGSGKSTLAGRAVREVETAFRAPADRRLPPGLSRAGVTAARTQAVVVAGSSDGSKGADIQATAPARCDT
jgi:hypothetical protein